MSDMGVHRDSGFLVGGRLCFEKRRHVAQTVLLPFGRESGLENVAPSAIRPCHATDDHASRLCAYFPALCDAGRWYLLTLNPFHRFSCEEGG